MAKTIEQIQEEVQQIKNETVAKQNTATRVGGALEDIVDHVEHYISDVVDRGVAEAVAAVEAKAQSIDKLTGDVATLGSKVGELPEGETVAGKISELEEEVDNLTTEKIDEIEGVKNYNPLSNPLPIGTYTLEWEYSNYGNQFYYAELYSAVSGGSSVTEVVNRPSSSMGSGKKIITTSIEARSLRIGVGSGTIPSNAKFTLKIYKDKTIVYQSDIETEVNDSDNPVSSKAVNDLGKSIENDVALLTEKFKLVYVDKYFSTSGRYNLSKTLKAGKTYPVKIKFNPWGVYTILQAYSGANATGDSQKIREYFYTADETIMFTPSFDCKSIRVDCGNPGSGASGYIHIEEDIDFALQEDIDKLQYKDEQTTEGVKGYIALSKKLLKGHVYKIDYDVKDYGGQFYYAELYSAVSGGSSCGTILQVSAQSNIKGTTILTPSKDALSVRVGLGGGGTVPETAKLHLDIVEVFQFADKFYVDEGCNAIKSIIDDGYPIIQDYFNEEMEATIRSVDSLTSNACFVAPILTDNHWRWTTEQGNRVSRNSINNVSFFCKKVYCDGIAHLGDILDTGVIGSTSDTELYSLMQTYLMRLSVANKNFYPINGNHDGERANNFKEPRWYGMIGRATANESSVHRYEQTPYFYVDHKPTKLRCIFLANPDNVDGVGTTWGFSQRELDWLSDALDVEDDYSVIFFGHIAPLKGYADSASNLNSFKTICETFNSSHSGKILAFICGHEHVDLVCNVGWNYEDISNIMPFPIVILGATYWNLGTSDVTSTWGGIRYGRTERTKTEDLWTVLVYRPDEGKLHFVRFGAGVDFNVSLVE